MSELTADLIDEVVKALETGLDALTHLVTPRGAGARLVLNAALAKLRAAKDAQEEREVAAFVRGASYEAMRVVRGGGLSSAEECQAAAREWVKDNQP